MLCGYNHHRQRGHPSKAGSSITAGVFLRSSDRSHTHTQKNCTCCSNLASWSCPLLAPPCNTFHCTEWVPFQRGSICGQARNGFCKGRGYYFFPCPIKIRGSRRCKNNRLVSVHRRSHVVQITQIEWQMMVEVDWLTGRPINSDHLLHFDIIFVSQWLHQWGGLKQTGLCNSLHIFICSRRC